MNIIFSQQLSVLLGFTVLATIGNGLSTQAQTVVPESTKDLANSSLSVAKSPIPGTTATSAAAFTRLESPMHSTKSVAEIAAPRVAQVDPNTAPSPGFETAPSPDAAPVPTTPTDPTAPVPTTPTDPTAPVPTTPTVNLTDVDPNYWAYAFIQPLASAGVITGFPDGSFRPEQPVTRAEFAAMIQKAFGQQNRVRQLPPNGFSDVPANYWGAAAIQQAYETGFLAGYPDNTFLPNQQIPKVEAISSLASGLGLTAGGAPADILNTYYTDAAQIPPYAVNAVAAATQGNVVVNYPNLNQLNPQVPLTRAEAAAHLYQALVRLGQAPPVPSNFEAANYIVGRPAVAQTTPTTPETTPTTPETTDTPSPETEPDVEPGRATRGGSSYLAVGANFGLTGDTALGDDVAFTVLSKIGLTRNFSVRPSVAIESDPAILIPITYDFNFQSAEAFDEGISIAPYAGAGVGITTGDDSEVGFLLTGGIDVPITNRFTATAAVNALFSGDTNVGVVVGIGYNFNGF